MTPSGQILLADGDVVISRDDLQPLLVHPGALAVRDTGKTTDACLEKIQIKWTTVHHASACIHVDAPEGTPLEDVNKVFAMLEESCDEDAFIALAWRFSSRNDFAIAAIGVPL